MWDKWFSRNKVKGARALCNKDVEEIKQLDEDEVAVMSIAILRVEDKLFEPRAQQINIEQETSSRSTSAVAACPRATRPSRTLDGSPRDV